MTLLPSTKSLRLAAAALLAAAAFTAAAAPSPPPERVQVTWAPNERVSEIKDNQSNRGWIRPEEWQKMLSDHLRKTADKYLPAGQRLDVSIDDIKLAGSFEPWRTRPGMDDVRVYKDIYPPLLKLHYKLAAADGTTIRENDATLRDASFLQRSIATTTDPLRYDKRMISEWLRKEFGPKRS